MRKITKYTFNEIDQTTKRIISKDNIIMWFGQLTYIHMGGEELSTI